ncbi:hypothetical protein DK842_09005 [Chromobacterium phragmitis]|uniref:DUF4340 domain-containing protein n=1 Tax=Chromobacterium phragmitis TaxID=2202141 RepID=A0ABV0IX98_9NEIS|nr:hypothetical protein [Chromobacterium phragmitis]AXE30020.1 hypothetical protein DK842_09005 [Chromobacterium phragmitis]
MERKTRLRLAVGIAALALAALAAGWLWRGDGIQTERLDLRAGEGRREAAAIMNRVYGSQQHDEKRNCWRYLREDGGDYCLKPLALDRVEAGKARRLYLFASGRRDGARDEDLSGLAGAFVVDADTLSPIAGSRELDFLNHRASGPDQVQLLQLSGDGYMGWFAAGRAAPGDVAEEFPHFYAPKDDKVLEIGGEVFGRDGETADGVKFAYQLDSGGSDARMYPLSLIVRDGKDKQLASFDFRFDRRRWEYVCADVDCRVRAGLPVRPERTGRVQGAEAVAADASEALFGKGRKLSETDLRDVLGQMGVSYVAQDGAVGFVDRNGCDAPYPLDAHFERDGVQEQLWVRGGDGCTSGDVGGSVWIFVRDAGGRLRANLGTPAADVRRTRDVSAGVHDLRVGAAGFCDRIWRWNGKAFIHLLNVPTQAGGCDSA